EIRRRPIDHLLVQVAFFRSLLQDAELKSRSFNAVVVGEIEAPDWSVGLIYTVPGRVLAERNAVADSDRGAAGQGEARGGLLNLHFALTDNGCGVLQGRRLDHGRCDVTIVG